MSELPWVGANAGLLQTLGFRPSSAREVIMCFKLKPQARGWTRFVTQKHLEHFNLLLVLEDLLLIHIKASNRVHGSSDSIVWI